MSVTIGQRLKELRNEKGLSTQELATQTGIKPSRVNFYEKDKGTPTLPILQRLANGLECTIFDIIDEPFGRKKDKCIHSEICPFYQKKFEEC